MNIFLIGYRCTGKTRVGQTLARRLGRTFLDTDAEVVRENGMTISEMVERRGWDYFREKERSVLQRICGEEDQVIATGGGIILDPRNVSNMAAAGRVVWLKARPTTIADRMGRDDHTEAQRPSLTGKTPVDEIEETLVARLPLYQGASQITIDTDYLSIDAITDSILSKIPSNGLQRPQPNA